MAAGNNSTRDEGKLRVDRKGLHAFLGAWFEGSTWLASHAVSGRVSSAMQDEMAAHHSGCSGTGLAEATRAIWASWDPPETMSVQEVVRTITQATAGEILPLKNWLKLLHRVPTHPLLPHALQLPAWAEHQAMLAPSTATARASPDASLNARLRLWQGDITRLEVR